MYVEASRRATPPRTRVRVLACACFFALLPTGGCGRRAAGPAEALAALAPRLDAFRAFDAWARATVTAEPSDPRSSAFHEVLFSPLQIDRDVLAAWVSREGPDPRVWELVDRASPVGVEPFTLVTAPGLGTVGVALVTLEDVGGGAGASTATVITRRARVSPSATIEVTVAYAR